MGRELRKLVWTGALWISVVGAAAEPAPVQVHQSGKIRVLYQSTGKHAVDVADANGNKIPDQVEDALTQTLAARMLWVELLGLPDPLDSVRYRKTAFLDIHFRHKDVVQGNGKAFDEMHPTRNQSDPPGTMCISFQLATSVKPTSNLTPAHEYFHLIQYASTYFKNRWFTEGTARWSEGGLGEGELGPVRKSAAWPLPTESQDKLYQQTYDAAEHFWNPLAKMTDADGKIPDSAALRALQAMTYTDGSAVLKDLRLTGWQLIRDVLRELGRQDAVAFRELEYETWSEENQKSPRNNAYLMRAVESVMGNQRKDAR